MIAKFATLFVVAIVVASSGCAPSYDRLRSETQIPLFSDLAARWAAMPRQNVLVPTTRPGEPMVRVGICRTGNPAARGPIIVFVHGTFSDARTWRYVAAELGEDHTLWLIDLPGCGTSDKPSPAELGASGYGPEALGDRLYQAIGGALAGESGDRRIIFIAHSTGAMLVTRMVADPELRARHSAVVARVAGAMLISPLDVAAEKPVPTLEYIAHVSDLQVKLGSALGLLRERITRGTTASYEDPSIAPREEVDRTLRILTGDASRHAMQAMILQATPRRRDEVRPDWPEVDRLVRQYANIDVPVGIVCGAHDETLPTSMSYKLLAQIPGATLTVIPNCMHSPHLEQPQTCARMIQKFLERIDPPPATQRRPN